MHQNVILHVFELWQMKLLAKIIASFQKYVSLVQTITLNNTAHSSLVVSGMKQVLANAMVNII